MQVFKFIRSTAIAGFFLLLPLLLVILLLSKIWPVIQRMVHVTATKMGVEHLLGNIIVTVISVLIIFLFCFLLGLLLRIAAVGRWSKLIERKLLHFIPGYIFIKSILGEKLGHIDTEEAITVVGMQFNETLIPGILIEEDEKGLCTVFVPVSPDTKSGRIYIVDKNKIEPLSISVAQFHEALQNYGRGILNSDRGQGQK